MTESIRVVVAEDDFFTREGICNLLNSEAGIEVVGSAENGEKALELVTLHQPDVLLLDIRMPPGIDGIEVIRRLRRAGNPVKIVVLTSSVKVAGRVEQEGANGFLPKDKHPMFIPTVRCVAQTGSKIFINPERSEAFRHMESRLKQAELNELEMAILRLLPYKNEEIARRLHKSPGRIRNLITELYFKLNLEDTQELSQRMQAIQLARVLGILEEPPLEETP